MIPLPVSLIYDLCLAIEVKKQTALQTETD